MSKIKHAVYGVLGAGFIASSAYGIVSAETTKNTNHIIGSSGIPSSIFRQEKLDAMSQVLNTSPSNVSAAIKGKTLKQLISNDNLTGKTFIQKAKSQLVMDLESKGYTQDQATIAMQSRTIHHLRHELKKIKG